MMMRKMIFVVVLIILSAYGCAEQEEPAAVFEKVLAQYKSMETYQDEGVIVADIETEGMNVQLETSFSIKLKKPNLYLVTWAQKNMPMPGMDQSGAVWNSGAQPYLYMGMAQAYSKISNDDFALSAATGISGGAAFTVPSLFLPVFKNQDSPFARLVDPKIEKVEEFEGEKCYVISGSSNISKKETYWISKKRNLIMKYSRSFESPEGGRDVPEMTDEELEATIKGMGLEVTEARKEEMKKQLEMEKAAMEGVEMKGFSTESHLKVNMPELAEGDFEFNLPEGSILKKSLFDDD